jgi:hypothetical protein
LATLTKKKKREKERKKKVKLERYSLKHLSIEKQAGCCAEIPALWRLRQEGHELEASLGYMTLLQK